MPHCVEERSAIEHELMQGNFNSKLDNTWRCEMEYALFKASKESALLLFYRLYRHKAASSIIKLAGYLTIRLHQPLTRLAPPAQSA